MKILGLRLLFIFLLVECFLTSKVKIRDDQYATPSKFKFDMNKIVNQPELKHKMDNFFKRINNIRTHTSKL